MISASPFLSSMAMTLLSIAFIGMLTPTHKLQMQWRLIVLLGVAALTQLPLGAYPAWYYLRGFFGDPSVTALFFYTGIVLNRYFLYSVYSNTEFLVLRRSILLSALTLYPLALGLSQFDSYQLGYANPWVLATLLALGFVCWARKWYFLAALLSAVVYGYTLRILESQNLWDYLIDVGLVLAVGLSWFSTYKHPEDTRGKYQKLPPLKAK